MFTTLAAEGPGDDGEGLQEGEVFLVWGEGGHVQHDNEHQDGDNQHQPHVHMELSRVRRPHVVVVGGPLYHQLVPGRGEAVRWVGDGTVGVQ